MFLGNVNISLMASGLFWLFVFLVIFKTLKGKGATSAIASSNAEAKAVAAGNVGGINIHLHTSGSVGLPNGVAGEFDNRTYSLPANDPLVSALLSRVVPIAEIDETHENETVVFS